MNVLIACEESQTVCKAFREKGHKAYSADIQLPSGGHPEWHIWGDVLPLINGNRSFKTLDGFSHIINGEWDLLIAHPPCTYLTNAGAVRMRVKGEIVQERYEKAMEAKNFFMMFYNAKCKRIAIENPTPMKIVGLPVYDQAIQPYEYGHPYSKRTCLWLKGLPRLMPTKVLTYHEPYVNGVRDPKIRSKTFPGIAKAMAEQWGVECESKS